MAACPVVCRCISRPQYWKIVPSTIARYASSSTGPQTAAQPKPGTASEPEKPDSQPSSSANLGWLSRLLVKDADSGRTQQSSQLGSKDTVYELQFHCVKPEHMEQYVKEFQQFVEMNHQLKTGAELSASWTVEVGDLDEAIHLWKFEGGYPMLDKHKAILRNNDDFVAFRRRRNMMLRYRKNQILLAFSFWPEIAARAGPNIYELRSYTLKPGTMIEWGSNWVRGLKLRQEKNEAVAGFFSHIGELYQAHHLWAFENLEDRKEVRESAWSHPGWEDVVAKTVPLMRHMTARILIPMPFSPLK